MDTSVDTAALDTLSSALTWILAAGRESSRRAWRAYSRPVGDAVLLGDLAQRLDARG